MSKKKHADGTDADATEAVPGGSEMREEAGKLIYSVAGVDILERSLATPGQYTVLADCADCDYRKGEIKQLCEPFDEQVLCTLRDAAKAMGLAN